MKNKKIFKCTMVAIATLMLGVSSNAYAFSVDFEGVPVHAALKALGIKAERDVVISSDLKGSVSMHMEDADFDTCLRTMAAVHNFSYRYDGNIVIVGDQKNMMNMEMFSLKYLDPVMFKKHIEPIISDDKDAVVNTDLHSISVMGSASVLQKVRELVEIYDVAQQQVNIQATVIELSKGKARNIGYNIGLASGKHSLGMTHSPSATNFQKIHASATSNKWKVDVAGLGDNAFSHTNGFFFSGIFNHEDAISDGKVLARPNVTVFDGRQAVINMGDEVPVFTSTGTGDNSNANVNVEYKNVGINVKVTPRINDLEKGLITLSVRPVVSTITEWVESGNNKAPQISSREVETIVRVKAGETILIGGLLKHDEIKNFRAFPLLHKIPILGELFKSRSIDKSDTELVIAITPNIIYDKDGVPRVDMQTLSPNLHQKMMELQEEQKDYNLLKEQQKEYEEQIKQLNNEKGALEKAYEAKNKEYSEKMGTISDENKNLKAERDALLKELEKSNEVLSSFIDKIRGKRGAKR